MRVSAKVPMRIDLAGGTLDVYPLYLFEGGGLTVNAAIDCMASALVESLEDGPAGEAQLVLCSEDLGCEEEVASLEEMAFGGPLELAKRALAYYRPEGRWRITLHSEAPQGSGLGASSALLMALSACLNEITARGFSETQIIDIGANIEAQVIGIPTGKQDYFPPIFGGVCAMWFGLDGWTLESLSAENDIIAWLDQRLIVSYTGVPHSSAATNWAMLKAYIEREGNTVERMGEIKAIAQAMRECLLDVDLGRFAQLLDDEWMLRRGLAEGVTNPQVEAIMAAAREAGALANKICGAGGGGCMITVAEPGVVPTVKAALTRAGAMVMPVHVVHEGMALEIVR
jgi:D-glycero-alpha-D-manno-heptose-7-phosphate kinase